MTLMEWGDVTTKFIACKQANNNFSYRYSLNVTAAFFVAIGTVFDIGTYYYSKDVQIFDEVTKEEKEKVELDLELKATSSFVKNS